MTDNEISEGNKLILIFMGGVIVSSTKYPAGKVIIHSIHLGDKHINDFINEIRFHKSWDKLMPVVEKIEKLGWKFKQCRKRVQIFSDKHTGEDAVVDVKEETKILSAHKAVVEFIEWYNKQSK